MLYTPLTKQAMKIMTEAHAGQKDRSGLPYLLHPWHVAESMEDELSTVVALLHDVVEDTDVTFADLEEWGIPEEVLGALHLLTHEEDVPYMEYVEKLSDNALARKVKLSDLRHNSDLSRLPEISAVDIERYKKYQKAIALLEEKEEQK